MINKYIRSKLDMALVHV